MLFLIFLLLNLSCASNIYNITQIKKNKRLKQKILNKKVTVYKTDGNVINGYIKAITPDSIFISSQNKNAISVPVANKDIRKIRKENNLVFLLLIPAVAIIYFVGRSSAELAKGASKTD